MKWHVKIWLSPVVQEEPEEFDEFDLDKALHILQTLADEFTERTIREIRITKAPDAQDLP